MGGNYVLQIVFTDRIKTDEQYFDIFSRQIGSYIRIKRFKYCKKQRIKWLMYEGDKCLIIFSF